MKRQRTLFLILAIIAPLLAACSVTPHDEAAPTDPPSSSDTPSDGSSVENDPDDPANIAEIDKVIEALQNPAEWVVIDVRTPEEYNGESRLPNAYGSGRLKGAVNVNRELVLDSEGELLPHDELLELYGFIGDRKVIVYCHGGTRSAFIWTVLKDLGFDVLNYSGSWIDWSRAASVADGAPNELVLSLTEEWVDNEGEV